eukprot:1360521-Amorphochlora_amoeboformis.AAC.1
MAVVTIPRVRGSGINLGTDVESVKAELLSQCKVENRRLGVDGKLLTRGKSEREREICVILSSRAMPSEDSWMLFRPRTLFNLPCFFGSVFWTLLAPFMFRVEEEFDNDQLVKV